MVFWRSPRLSIFTRKNARKSRKLPQRPRWKGARWACLLATAGLSTGCMTSNDELKFFGNEREITHYRDQTARIDYPNVAQQVPETVTGSQPPRRVRHPKKDEIRELTLEEALRTALLNAEVVRGAQEFMNPGNRLLSNPDFATSIYDVAIQESNQLFGQGGVQAALAEFDATLLSAPDASPVYSTRGSLHFEMGHLELAGADFAKAAELEPENPKHRNNL